MSLINDALKKAQRQQNNGPMDAPMPGGGGRPRRGGSGMPTQTIMLIVAGCALLVVLSGLGAVLFVNSGSKPKPAAAAAAVSPAPAPAASSATANSSPSEVPALVIQPIKVAVKNEPPSATTPVVTAPAPTKATPMPIPPASSSPPTTVVKSEPAPVEVQAPAPKAAPATPPTRVPDERVHAYLDELRVNAVRVAGAGSRVRLNDKVYRINDVVDRSLNLRLTTVENEFLLFTDANGVEYRKNF